MEETKILIIDDEKSILDSIKMVLNYENYSVKTATDGLGGIDLFKNFKPHIVLLDVKIPGMGGLEILRTLKSIDDFSEIIMISGHSGIEEAVESSKLGAFDFLEKPISREKLILTVRNASEKVNLKKENYYLKSINLKSYELKGSSPLMQELKKKIGKVARTNSTVLIFGESGTGKELIARNIHLLSKRRENRFVHVNCAAIPEELIESELFGHEKGSFTGAVERKIGKFDSAHKGSIFLDEIGDLSMKAQAKVLRVLEEGEVQRVGSDEIKKVDVRVIAATNKDLRAEIGEGKFREDLFFRLNVVPIISPTLNERLEDIPLLVEYFVNLFSEENNFKKKLFGPDAMESLLKHNWKGNIRELRNLVERVLIMSESRVIGLNDLPDYFRSKDSWEDIDFYAIKKWRDFKKATEKLFIEKKLALFDNNIARTAREIDIPRSNLYKKIENLGIIAEDKKGEAGNGPLRESAEESPGSEGKDGF